MFSEMETRHCSRKMNMHSLMPLCSRFFFFIDVNDKENMQSSLKDIWSVWIPTYHLIGGSLHQNFIHCLIRVFHTKYNFPIEQVIQALDYFIRFFGVFLRSNKREVYLHLREFRAYISVLLTVRYKYLLMVPTRHR